MFDHACALIDQALTGDFRRQLVDEIPAGKGLGDALGRLRHSLRSHALTAGARHIDLQEVVRQYDKRTRKEGFHVLHDWDGKAGKVNPDTIPVDVLNYLIDQRGAAPADRRALAVLLDYYLLHLLSLLTLRIWDEGNPRDADAHLGRLDALLRALQSADGSGHRFVDNAATLLLVATSHYEVNEQGFHALLARVRTLGERQQVAIALGHAASLGCHLRFGFEATCGRDTSATRDDNVADYPWLGFSLATLMREYSRTEQRGLERGVLVEALLNGLTPDTRAFVGEAPASLAAYEADRSQFRDLFQRHKSALVDAFGPHRPTSQSYSPLSFFFNFSHNVLKGMVVHELLRIADRGSRIPPLSLNDLFTALPHDETRVAKEAMAKTLMGYARANPDTIRGRQMPVIVYDPQTGREAFSVTMRKLKE